MPLYITLLRWTEEGIRKVKDSPSRLDKAKEAMQASGGQFKAFYMTLGRYDAVVVGESPDDATYAKTLLSLASSGAIKTETLRAFSEEEYREIIGSLG